MKIGKFAGFCHLVVTKAKTRSGSTIKSFFIALLTFVLAVTWGNPASGQIPFFPLNDTKNSTPIIDFFNRPHPCGNLVCTRIWFAGMPIFEIAAEPIANNEQESAFSVELRAKNIQNDLQQILTAALTSKNTATKAIAPKIIIKETITPNRNNQKSTTSTGTSNPQPPATNSTGTSNPQPSATASPDAVQPEADKQQVARETPNLKQEISQPPSKDHRLHPDTPQIEVGTLNNQTVIYAPEQPGLLFQDILTVTRADVLHNGQLTEELAQEWLDTIRFYMSRSLRERDLEAQYPFFKPGVIFAFFLVMLLLSFGVAWIQKHAQAHYKKLKTDLWELEESLTKNPESASGEELAGRINQDGNSEDTQYRSVEEDRSGTIAANLLAKSSPLKENSRVPEAKISYREAVRSRLAFKAKLRSFWSNLPKLFLKAQSILKQRLNLMLLVLQTLLWVQALIWVWGTGFVFRIYPSTRALGVLLVETTFPIIGIWVSVTLADKVSNFLVDFYLNKWAENAQLTYESSPRYALRVSTYSVALNNTTKIIFLFVGIILTAEILGVATTVLASAGVIAVVVTYFSQNLVRDGINGLLILLSDRYAVGDWIMIDDSGGIVEKMNLYMTELRTGNGELITIPNGSITVVKNLTKNWSRVNFTIEVAYDADIKQVLQLLREVFEQMYAEPEWGEKIVEPIVVLGVDEVSHTGMLIRIWIKTLPLQQWLVGREFRLRVKLAFDREGIAIGVPQRSLSVKNSPYIPNSNGSNIASS